MSAAPVPGADDQSGLLIVNADDLGHHDRVTDAIIQAFDAGGITSATAMVWMSDSERAASLARGAGLPVGLHLNLTTAFSDPRVPPGIAAHQAKLNNFFRARSRWLYNPRLRRSVELVISAQLGEFQRLYDAAPTHIDGHHHIHVSPNVSTARALPRGTKMRGGFTFFPGEAARSTRVVLGTARLIVTWRFRCPSHLFALPAIHPQLGGTGLTTVHDLAKREPVEVMCHPARGNELAVLASKEWRGVLTELPLGSFDQL